MRVLLSMYDSRGGVEPLAGLAVRGDQPYWAGREVAATLLAGAISRERPPVPA
jgi:hypothetical protein